MPSPATADTNPAYNPNALFEEDGPINPTFIHEAVRTLMRALPLDQAEPQGWGHRRMFSAMCALAALHPRDEIEVMLGVQALAAYHAAGACWRLGMNSRIPNGDSTRHIGAAGSAARTFDALLKALERRQAKSLKAPEGRPPSRSWAGDDPTLFMQAWEERCRRGESRSAATPSPTARWSDEDVVYAEQRLKHDRTERQNEGLDIANTEGILPGGGMIMPEDPTPQQAAYIGRRLGLMYRREYEENLRQGRKVIPKIKPLRPGDLIP